MLILYIFNTTTDEMLIKTTNVNQIIDIEKI